MSILPKNKKELNFTKKCILMSVISQEKNIILLNSFNTIPIVKLYTTNSNYENFIYSKIKGALCLFMNNKESKNKIYYLRIYDIKNYSILFNMELKHDHLKLFIQYSDDFYFLELYDSYLGFKFNTKENARKFSTLIKQDQNPEIIEQNEKALNIKSKEVSKTIIRINDIIKNKLQKNFEKTPNKKGGWFSSSKKIENFNKMVINDKKGEFLNLSIIPDIYLFLKNIEISQKCGKLLIFCNDSYLQKNICQNIILKYEPCFDFTNSRSNFKIIEKDFYNILNKALYTDILTNNMINVVKVKEKLQIFKREHNKRLKKKQGLIQKKNTKIVSKKSHDFRRGSRQGSDFSLLENMTIVEKSNSKRASFSIQDSGKLIDIFANKEKENKKEKHAYINDKKTISELATGGFNMINSDSDSDDNDEAGVKYFTDEKEEKKPTPAKPVMKKSKTGELGRVKNMINSDDKKKNKSSNKKNKADIMSILGEGQVIMEIDEDEEKDNKKDAINNFSNYHSNNLSSRGTKSSMIDFLMNTKKIGK